MDTQTQSPKIDETKLNAFMGKAVMDMGAALHATLVVVGDKLGLYKAMAGSGWLTSAELAAKTNTSERYVREWLNANAARLEQVVVMLGSTRNMNHSPVCLYRWILLMSSRVTGRSLSPSKKGSRDCSRS